MGHSSRNLVVTRLGMTWKGFQGVKCGALPSSFRYVDELKGDPKRAAPVPSCRGQEENQTSLQLSFRP